MEENARLQSIQIHIDKRLELYTNVGILCPPPLPHNTNGQLTPPPPNQLVLLNNMDVLCVQVNKIITMLDALAPTVASASGRRASGASASRRSSNITVFSRAGGDDGDNEMTQGATAAQTALEQAALLAGIYEALGGVIKDQYNACVWFEGEQAQTST